MTRKDYELIATAVRDSAMDRPTYSQQVQRRFTAMRLADALASQNPRFNRERFLAACGVES